MSDASYYWDCLQGDFNREEITLPSLEECAKNFSLRRQTAQELIDELPDSSSPSLQKFIAGLPSNHTIHVGFHIPSGASLKVLYCPCSRIVTPWMQEYQMNLEDHIYCSHKFANKPFHVQGLKTHLWQTADDFHKAAYNYITRVYTKDYKFPTKDLPVGASDLPLKYMLTVNKAGSLGVGCSTDVEGVCILSKIFSDSILQDKVQIGDIFHEMNGMRIKQQENLTDQSSSNTRYIIMRRNHPDHPDADDQTSNAIDVSVPFRLCLTNSALKSLGTDETIIMDWTFLKHVSLAVQLTVAFMEKQLESKTLTPSARLFVESLPSCLPLQHTKRSFCPCNSATSPWRDSCKMKNKGDFKCKNDRLLSSKDVMDHLKTVGGNYYQKQRHIPIRCLYHHAALVYLCVVHEKWSGFPDLKRLYDSELASMDTTNSTIDTAAGKGLSERAITNRLIDSFNAAADAQSETAQISTHDDGNNDQSATASVSVDPLRLSNAVDPPGLSDDDDEGKKHDIQLLDCVKYWPPTATVGDKESASYGIVLEIKEISEEMDGYSTYLWLDSGTYIHYTQVIEVSRSKLPAGGYDFTKECVRQGADKYLATHGRVDDKTFREAMERRSNLFATIRQVAANRSEQAPTQEGVDSEAGESPDNAREQGDLPDDEDDGSRSSEGKDKGTGAENNHLSHYCDPFTFRQRFSKQDASCHYTCKDKLEFCTRLSRRPETQYRADINKEVISWTSRSKPVIQIGGSSGDEPMGEDYFSAQQTYVKPNGEIAGSTDIQVPQSLIEEHQERETTIDPHTKYLDCSKFISSIHHMRDKISKKMFLKAIGAKGKDIDLKIVEYNANAFVDDADDIELFDWAKTSFRAKLWFCSDIGQSSKLYNAIRHILQHKCESQQEIEFLAQEGMALKFLGFVSADTNGNKVETFHIKSFVLYEDSSRKDYTIVRCIITARHLIAVNMQERLLQIMQMMQFPTIRRWNVLFSSESLRLLTLDVQTKAAFLSMNFNTRALDTHFKASTKDLIPTAIYSDRLTWIKYGRSYFKNNVEAIEEDDEETLKKYRIISGNLLSILYLPYEDNDEATKSIVRMNVHTNSHIFRRYREEATARKIVIQECMARGSSLSGLVECIMSTAVDLTRISFSFFTHLLFTASPRPTMFESTLQLLQQFYVQLKSTLRLQPYTHHIGDGSTYCVCCKKCQREITPSGDIALTLHCAPAAMLIHLGLHFDENRINPLLNSNEVHFQHSLEWLGSFQPPSPCEGIDKQSMFGFCEALKIDNNIQYRSYKERKDVAIKTLSFINLMFETVANYEDAGSQVSDNTNKNNKGYASLFAELISNREDPDFVQNDNGDIPIRLNKGWNLFMSRQYIKNLVDVTLISVKSDKDEWRKDIFFELIKNWDLGFSDEYIASLWCKNGNDHQMPIMLNHEEERPSLESEYKEFNCESIMGSTGLGWDKAGANKYLHGRNISARKRKVSTLSECEEAMILLITAKRIRKITIDDEIHFEIECKTDRYEKKNSELRSRHADIFRSNKFIYMASDDLVRSMRYTFVDDLVDGQFTNLESEWLSKVRETSKAAENLTIRCIQLVRINKPFSEEREAMFRVRLKDSDKTNDKWFVISSSELINLIGNENQSCPWSSGEMSNLSIIGSNILITLGLGAKRKELNHIGEGDSVIVSGHGNWNHTATIINLNSLVATVKWDSDRTTAIIPISKIKGLNTMDIGQRKRYATDRYGPDNPTENKKYKEYVPNQMMKTNVQHMYSATNPLNLCTEGAVANLLRLLCVEKEQVDNFLRICQLPMDQIRQQLGDDRIPAKVLTKDKMNKLQLMLWILRKMFAFSTTPPIQTKSLKQIPVIFEILSQFKFPVLISATAKNTQYNHVVVVWNKKIIDYEAKGLLMLTTENLSQICGQFTTTMQIEEGYGLFPPASIQEKNSNYSDWGIQDFKFGRVRRFFQ